MEQEDQRLRRIVAEQALDVSMLKDLQRGKFWARRDAAAYLVQRNEASERRACPLVDQHRPTQRYQPIVLEQEQRLVVAMNRLATAQPRWGYRLVYQVLRDES
jgi:hypothetical protein